MTRPGLPPLADAGNILLSDACPDGLVTGTVPLAGGGKTGVATIRSANTTLTIFMDRDKADQWAEQFTVLRDQLSGGGAGLVIPQRGDAIRIADAVRSARPPGDGRR